VGSIINGQLLNAAITSVACSKFCLVLVVFTMFGIRSARHTVELSTLPISCAYFLSSVSSLFDVLQI
jgi:hypothetical protein